VVHRRLATRRSAFVCVDARAACPVVTSYALDPFLLITLLLRDGSSAHHAEAPPPSPMSARQASSAWFSNPLKGLDQRECHRDWCQELWHIRHVGERWLGCAAVQRFGQMPLARHRPLPDKAGKPGAAHRTVDLHRQWKGETGRQQQGKGDQARISVEAAEQDEATAPSSGR